MSFRFPSSVRSKNAKSGQALIAIILLISALFGGVALTVFLRTARFKQITKNYQKKINSLNGVTSNVSSTPGGTVAISEPVQSYIQSNTDCGPTLYALRSRSVGAIVPLLQKITADVDAAQRRSFYRVVLLDAKNDGTKVKINGTDFTLRARLKAKVNEGGMNRYDMEIESYKPSTRTWEVAAQFACPRPCNASPRCFSP